MDKEEILGALLAQEQAHHNPVKKVTPGMPELLRSVAAQGAVLLENRVLPFPEGSAETCGLSSMVILRRSASPVTFSTFAIAQALPQYERGSFILAGSRMLSSRVRSDAAWRKAI